MSGLLKKLAVSLLIVASGFAPLWVFFLTKEALGPAGPWQKLPFSGLCSGILGGFQILMAIAVFYFLAKIWTDDPW